MLVVWVFFIAALYKMITHYVACTCRSLGTTSFDYNDQNPAGVLLPCANQDFCCLNLAGITKFKYKRKNERDSGRSSKMTPLCKWPNSKYSNFIRRGSCDRNITLTVNLYEDALPRGKLTNSQLIEMFVLLKVLNQFCFFL